MQENEERHTEERHTDRRRLLRGAGAVVAGVAGAGVAGAVTASPAAADTGDPVTAGKTTTANATTGIELAGAPAPATTPALRLTNTAGPALTADPVDSTVVNDNAPAGSLYIDKYGDIFTVGDVNGVKFTNPIYSPTWATMVAPVPATRLLDTRGETSPGTAFVVPGSGTISGGKIVPKGTNKQDLALDFSSLLVENYVAVQVIVSVLGASADGWLTLWGDGDWPGAVSVNFLGGRVIGGFAQCELSGIYSSEPFGQMKIKITHKAAITVDVVGFITPDPYTMFKPAATSTFKMAAARMPKVAPRKPTR